ESMLHAGRVGAELPSCSRGQLDDVEDFLHALVVDAGEVGDHPHVFPATQVGVEAGGLDEGADLGQSGGVAGGVAGGGGRAGGRPYQADEHAQGGGLARSVRGEAGVDLATAHAPVNVVDG